MVNAQCFVDIECVCVIMRHPHSMGRNMIDRYDIDRVFVYVDGALIRRSTMKRGYKRPDGYVYSRLLGRQYPEHRLVFLLHKGYLPEQVDHMNGIRCDNRIENLRDATHAQNCMNRKPMGRSSKGCYWQEKRGKWIAQIGFKGKRITIGYFNTEHEASLAYEEKSKELHGEFSRVR